ncbi:MAG: phosphoribosyl-AMP cyclohydrolase [Spirochaetes bacterium GWC1_27_15]|nr:MAG: phosphoribosyl-AMP cyclohydrolase [Spirochaetes bacterium GWB1_27_13]OHD20664.1 MAG: phosphoribosyl-AMP cyclohydrolase [Spirochaetes bacterium GWC1_27_15]
MDINFDKMGGIVPVVTQDAVSNKILMVAFVNKEAFLHTLKTGKATYFSRTKNRLWCKGEESGNYQEIVDILIDCDNDTLIYKVNQKGLKASCHEGYESCFYRHLSNDEWVYNGEPKIFEPKDVYILKRF